MSPIRLGTLDCMLGWTGAVGAASFVDRRMGTGRIRLGVERVDVRRIQWRAATARRGD